MTIAKLLKLETRISDATLIITGEGRFDRQTAAGKVPLGVAKNRTAPCYSSCCIVWAKGA